jgi:hypothetical protein
MCLVDDYQAYIMGMSSYTDRGYRFYRDADSNVINIAHEWCKRSIPHSTSEVHHLGFVVKFANDDDQMLFEMKFV